MTGRSGLAVTHLDDAMLRSFLLSEAENVAKRIGIPSRGGFVYDRPEGQASAPPRPVEPVPPPPDRATADTPLHRRSSRKAGPTDLSR